MPPGIENEIEITNRYNHTSMEFKVTTRILLVDDHWEVRDRLRILLMQEPDFELIGEAGDGEEALEILSRRPIDVVILDLNLPGISGIEIAKRILQDRPETRVIIVSMQSNPHYVKESFNAGVGSYVLKDCAFEEMVKAVRIVVAGGTYVSPEIRLGMS